MLITPRNIFYSFWFHLVPQWVFLISEVIRFYKKKNLLPIFFQLLFFIIPTHLFLNATIQALLFFLTFFLSKTNSTCHSSPSRLLPPSQSLYDLFRKLSHKLVHFILELKFKFIKMKITLLTKGLRKFRDDSHIEI